MNFNNVASCSLWQEVLDTLNRKGALMGWNNVDGYPYLQCCLFEKDWINNIISCDNLEKLSEYTPILIASQTGTGKTTLVFENMLKIATNKGKKILHFSNRVLLGRQVKQKCMEDENNGKRYVDDIRVKDFPMYFTEKYIKNNTKFGGIDVYSYQSFLYKHDDINPDEYAFVVFDESHSFMSDATFNVYTEEVLDILVRKFADIPRVYLTATPDECLEAIYNKEINVAKNRRDTRYQSVLKVYVFREDYRYLLPRFFDSMQFIIDKIKKSSESENWVIFVRDKKTGCKLLEELQVLQGGAMYITAESDKEDVLFKELIAKEKLPKRILITTRVLDVGVNINTSNLKMVIFENDVVEVKQMVGRKRIKPNEELEVYFHIPSYNELRKRQKMNEQELIKQRANVLNVSRMSTGYISDLSKYYPLYFHNGIKANYLSICKYQYDKQYYDALLECLNPCKFDENEYQKEYAALWLRNFTGQAYGDSMMSELLERENMKDEVKEQVRQLSIPLLGTTISKEQLVLYSEQLEEIVGDCRSVKRSDRGPMGYHTLSNLLPSFGLEISSTKTNPVTYQMRMLGVEE